MDEQKQQWLSIAAVVLVILGLGFFLYRQSREPQVMEPTPTPMASAEEKARQLVEKMKVTVPDNAERATLEDKTDSGNAGIATRVMENNRFKASVLAALPELQTKESYVAYLSTADDSDKVMLGKLKEAKGGWMLDYTGSKDLSDHKKITINKEVAGDKSAASILLSGEFK